MSTSTKVVHKYLITKSISILIGSYDKHAYLKTCVEHYSGICVTHVFENYVLHASTYLEACVVKTCVIEKS